MLLNGTHWLAPSDRYAKENPPEGGSLRAGWNLQFQRERLAFSFKLSQGTGRIGYLHLLRGAGAFIKRLCEKIHHVI